MANSLQSPPDLAAVKQRQQQIWASGDFHVVAALIAASPSSLCEAVDLHAGWRVLDVATGTGNAAIAAARLGCRRSASTTCRRCSTAAACGRRRGPPVELLDGDAEALPFADDSFDAVISVFGSMFAPDHPQAAAELVRVCRPGGTVALATWTPDGFIGEMLRTVGRHVPPPPGVASRCSGAASITCATCSATGSSRSSCTSARSRSASARPRSSSTSSAGLRADGEGVRGARGRRARSR